jgi:hypothetical protein
VDCPTKQDQVLDGFLMWYHSSNVEHLGACSENMSTLIMSHTITSRVASGKCS